MQTDEDNIKNRNTLNPESDRMPWGARYVRIVNRKASNMKTKQQVSNKDVFTLL
jgi:hypothetical protein